MSIVLNERIIFLDFDGVLHPFKSGSDKLFCRMPLIHRVLEQSPLVRVVVHSTWRHAHSEDEIRNFLFYERLDLSQRFLGCTDVKKLARWDSIEAWVKARNPNTAVCILDDEPNQFPEDIAKNRNPRFHFITCPTSEGLMENSPAWENLRRWLYARPTGK